VAVHYTIQESSDALEIRVRNEISLFLRAACGGFAGWLVWLVIGTHLPSPMRSGLAIAAGVCVVALFRQMTARLKVTNLEFQIGGSTLPTAKIHRLEFQEHDSGGQGLYAVTILGEPVVLPHVDAVQAQEIIAAIKKKFPGLAEMWRRSEAVADRSGGEN
jgi:hypothetical protein